MSYLFCGFLRQFDPLGKMDQRWQQRRFYLETAVVSHPVLASDSAALAEFQMRWVEKFLDQLDRSLEWQSLGTMAWRFHEAECWLRIAPCPLEVVGGADDGESVFPFYTLHVAALIEVFDTVPEMLWTTMHGEFSLDGKIGGDDAWITLYQAPFDDEEPRDVLDSNGGVRKKTSPEE